jgi:hypothetical protein
MAGAIVRASGAGWVIANPSAEALRQAVRGVADMEESARREFGRRGFEWMSAHMSSARSARAIAIAVEEARRRFPARSQLTHLVKAACGAWADVATRRSRRAGDVLLSPGLATRCETSLAAWLEGSRVTMVDEPPLEIPVLLAERPIPS